MVSTPFIKEDMIFLRVNGACPGLLLITLIDAVSIQTVSTASPVPVPGTGFLLGAGLAGLVGIRRRLNNYCLNEKSPTCGVAAQICNPHVLKYAPVAVLLAPCIWATFRPNTKQGVFVQALTNRFSN